MEELGLLRKVTVVTSSSTGHGSGDKNGFIYRVSGANYFFIKNIFFKMPVQAVRRYVCPAGLVGEGFQPYHYPYHCFALVGQFYKKGTVCYRRLKKSF